MRGEFHRFAEHDASSERFVARIRKFCPPPARLLELGSGAGGVAAALALAGFDVTGIDPDHRAVRAARLRAMRYPQTRQRFEEAFAEKLPFAEGSFDLVISNQVLEHVPRLDDALRECFRVLAPGGLTYHQLPNYAFFWEPHYRVPWLPYLPRAVAPMYFRLIGRSPMLFEQEIFPRYRRSLMTAFERCGFADVQNLAGLEVANKLTQGKLNSPGVSARVLSGLGRIKAVRDLVLLLDVYPALVISARKP